MAEAAPDAADAAAPVAGPDAAARRDESDGDAASESVELVERAKSAAVLGRDLEADAAAALVETATGYIPPWAWRFRRIALEALGGDPEHVLHRMLLDVLAIFASFVAAGVVVFHAAGAGSGDRRWRPGYCLYRFARRPAPTPAGARSLAAPRRFHQHRLRRRLGAADGRDANGQGVHDPLLRLRQRDRRLRAATAAARRGAPRARARGPRRGQPLRHVPAPDALLPRFARARHGRREALRGLRRGRRHDHLRGASPRAPRPRAADDRSRAGDQRDVLRHLRRQRKRGELRRDGLRHGRVDPDVRRVDGRGEPPALLELRGPRGRRRRRGRGDALVPGPRARVPRAGPRRRGAALRRGPRAHLSRVGAGREPLLQVRRAGECVERRLRRLLQSEAASFERCRPGTKHGRMR